MEGLAQFVSQSFDHKKRGLMLMSQHPGAKLPLDLFKEEPHPKSPSEVSSDGITNIRDKPTILPNPKSQLRLSISSLLADHGRKRDEYTKNDDVTRDSGDEYIEVDDVKNEISPGMDAFGSRFVEMAKGGICHITSIYYGLLWEYQYEKIRSTELAFMQIFAAVRGPIHGQSMGFRGIPIPHIFTTSKSVYVY